MELKDERKSIAYLEYDKIMKSGGLCGFPWQRNVAAALRPSAAMSDIIIWRRKHTGGDHHGTVIKGTPSFGGFREIRRS